jgi:predicted regulator of Ras-like GTPase activity (Roadblock/LC7/MglB family)
MMDPETIAGLRGLADLPVPDDRLELVAAAFAPLLAAAHELSRKMSADEMREVSPAVGFIRFPQTDSQSR